jgi:hypothetical protein
VFIAIALLLITILLGRMLIWWWPAIRVAWLLPGSAPKIATDSAVGLAQIALPNDWNQTDALPSNAALQAVDHFRNRYLTIISEPLDDFEVEVGLMEYTDLIMSNRARKQDVTRASGPSQRTVGCYQALQYEYSARVRGMRVSYLVTIVQGARAFHQVTCWSLSSAYNRRAFEKVVDGFEERPGPLPERPVAPTSTAASSGHTVH